MPPQDSRYPSDVVPEPWSHVRLWLFCGGSGLILSGLARDPVWVETVYVDGWGGQIAQWLATWTSGVSFSVAEIFIALLIVAKVLSVLEALSDVGARRRRVVNALVHGAAHTVDLVAILGLAFYVTWGVSYARAPALERLGWQDLVEEGEVSEASVAALYGAAQMALDETHAAYRALHGSEDAGALTEPREGMDVDAALENAFERAGQTLDLSPSFSASRGQSKRVLSSELMSWMGIGGIYIPFTGEANVNTTPPAWSQVFTMAHEKAHQRMVASEDEASFFGFLACVHGQDPLLRYAGWSFGFRQLRRALWSVDPELVASLDEGVYPGVRRDREAVVRHWRSYEGWLEELSRSVNDQYLKANHVEGGVLAYGRAGRLIAAYLESPQGQARYGKALADARARVASQLASRASAEAGEVSPQAPEEPASPAPEEPASPASEEPASTASETQTE